MDYKNLLVYQEGEIGVIKINRPEIRNALDSKSHREIEGALDHWEEQEDIKAIVFIGGGEKSFAAGADINQLKQRDVQGALQPGLSGVCQKVESSSKVTIAAINGFALGGGCELALSCDIRIAAKHAKLGLPELNLSIIPGGGGTQGLARIVGKGRALHMILTGEIVTAQKAEQIGLVSTVVPVEELWPTVVKYVNKIAKKGPLALKLAKMVVNQGFETDLKSALMLEKFAQAILFGSNDKKEGVDAFLEKREPIFKGK